MPCGVAVLDEGRVIAEMRIAMDHAKAAERLPPRLEHRDGEAVADRDVVALVDEKLVAVEPVEGEEPAGRKFGPGPRHPHFRGFGQHGAIERGVLGLALVIEFLADAFADLAGDFGGVDRRVHAAVNGEQPFELF